MPQQWKDAIIMVLHKKEGSDRVQQQQGYFAGSARWQQTAEDHRSPPQKVLQAHGDPARGPEWFSTEPLYDGYDVHDLSAIGVGAEETNSVVCLIY